MRLTILQGLFLGIVQGLTEFLPISSSGHLVLFQKLFGISEGNLTFEIAVHLATLIAVFIVFWKDIWEMIKKPFGKFPMLIIVATIPTAIMGVALKDLFEKIFQSGATLGIEFIFTGLILWYAESVNKKSTNKGKGLEDTNFKDAIIVGIAQGIAILPAVSRSGLTIAGSLFRGLNREFAAKFSFLVSIPAILGAAVIDVKDIAAAGAGMEFMPIIIGMVAAGVSGYFAIRFMLKILSKGSLKIFSYYVFILGGLIIIEQIFSGRIFGKLFF